MAEEDPPRPAEDRSIGERAEERIASSVAPRAGEVRSAHRRVRALLRPPGENGPSEKYSGRFGEARVLSDPLPLHTQQRRSRISPTVWFFLALAVPVGLGVATIGAVDLAYHVRLGQAMLHAHRV